MRFICLQENLKKCLNIVSHVTSKNINLPILNNILIRTNEGNIDFISTNLEIGIVHQMRGKIEKDGEFTVDSKIITEYIGLLSAGEKVKIEEKEGELKIECGNYKTKIKGEASKEFPLIPTISKGNPMVCKISDLKKALASIVFAVSNSDNRLELTGVLFVFAKNHLTLAATDSYRLAERNLEIKGQPEGGDQRVIVPAKTIQELLRILSNLNEVGETEEIKEINIYLGDSQILFTVDSISLISRLINGHYPDYKQIIPNKSQTEVLVERGELIRAIKASALFSKTGINDVMLQFSKNKTIVSSFSGTSGESQIELEAEVNGNDNEITINYRYLLDGLNALDGERVKLGVINNNTPCLVRPEKENGYLYIVMPIRQ